MRGALNRWHLKIPMNDGDDEVTPGARQGACLTNEEEHVGPPVHLCSRAVSYTPPPD